MSEKKYLSIKKLDSLPIGSLVRFGNAYSLPWSKAEDGWREMASSFPFPSSAKEMLADNRNRPYVIESIEEENK